MVKIRPTDDIVTPALRVLAGVAATVGLVLAVAFLLPLVVLVIYARFAWVLGCAACEALWPSVRRWLP